MSSRRRNYSYKQNYLAQGAFILSIFALSQSNFGDAGTRLLLALTAVAYGWVNWIIFPVLRWWWQRHELAKTIVIMEEEDKEK